MILSVSRRTDIPSYYAEWFFNRIKEGFVYVRNPMNPRQVGRIELSPEVVDCIVFWTKNPLPILDRLEELSAYPYYFQFTLTGYGRDVEYNLPHKKEQMIPVFQRLSKQLGRKRVIWRYDPILLTPRYTPKYHIRAFEQIADALQGYTDQCVVSFVDRYAKNARSLDALGVYEPDEATVSGLARRLSEAARANGMNISACAEKTDLRQYGIGHSCCIDKKRIEEIIGHTIKVGKDKNQRIGCGCVESVDIGAYNTCRNGCKYCYANHSPGSVVQNCSQYDAQSPLLCGVITARDRVSERKSQE